MHRPSTSAVRLLAAWQLQRRELSDRMESLLLHGPTAVDRVASRTEELRCALEAERTAFEAFVAVAAQPDRGATLVPADDDAPGAAFPPLRAVRDAGV